MTVLEMLQTLLEEVPELSENTQTVGTRYRELMAHTEIHDDEVTIEGTNENSHRSIEFDGWCEFEWHLNGDPELYISHDHASTDDTYEETIDSPWDLIEFLCDNTWGAEFRADSVLAMLCKLYKLADFAETGDDNVDK